MVPENQTAGNGVTMRSDLTDRSLDDRSETETLGNKMVRPARLERATFWFVARRSIQLSYGRITG